MNEKILIIDDEKDILTFLDSILTDEGFQVRSALRGEEAIEIFKSDPFDLVITDIRMPGMDGLEVVRQIKQTDKDMEIIILTGHATLEDAIQALRDDGAYDYLKKPLEDIDKLFIAVGEALERRKFCIENKKLVTELRESEKRYREIVEGTDDLIARVDSEGRFIYLNHMAEKIFGARQEECIGMSAFDFIHPDDRDRTMLWFNELVAKHQATGTIDNRQMNKKTGKIHEMLWTFNFDYDEKGNLMGVKGIARDLTDYKSLEARLMQVRKMEAIGTLAGGIAHQFNNALSPITANLDFLTMDYPNDENINTYVEQMRDSAHRMAHLSSQLLAYARGGKYQAKIVALSDFVRDTLPLIRHNLKPSVHIETDLSRNILSVKADLTQMQMVLSAILSNASEAIEGEGRIRITCKNEMITDERAKHSPGLNPGPYVNLKIEDDGKGMDEETKSRIFEPFFTTKVQGRGLSMAAAYGIIKNHDGWIAVDSKLGKGTTVRICLPAVETPVKEPEKPKIEPVTIKGTGTILVIENEEMVMDVTTAILERLGYSVLGAKTGKEAINIAKTFDDDIDLAILDLILPDMQGGAIYPHIMEARPNLKVIVFSGYSIDGPAQEILDAGAEDFIQKPFKIAELSQKLKEVLDKK